VVLCRQIDLFTQALAAVDGSKFKAVNTCDRNFTVTKLKKRMEQVAEHIAGYLADLDTADRQEGEAAEARAGKLKDKIATLPQMQALKAMETQVAASPDGQVSLTDPDARSMATSGRGSGIVGYNVQSVVDAEHHLIVAHDVITTGSDRQQLTAMSQKASGGLGEGQTPRGDLFGGGAAELGAPALWEGGANGCQAGKSVACAISRLASWSARRSSILAPMF
jgi:transposase